MKKIPKSIIVLALTTLFIVLLVLIITNERKERKERAEKVTKERVERKERKERKERIERIEREKLNAEGDKIAELAVNEIDNNNIEKAKKLIDSAQRIYPSHSKIQDLEELERQIERSLSEKRVIDELINLTDKEYRQLKSGELNKVFIAQNTLNKRYIKLMAKTSSKRGKLILEERRKRKQRKRQQRERERQQRERQQKEQQQRERKQKIESLFSGWDGRHRDLVRYVKRNMNDPSSFDHIETRYSDHGNYIIVAMLYRGANSYGGITRRMIRAKVDLDGNLLKITYHEPVAGF